MAGNMAGSVKGTAAVISAQCPLAYLHHCLNLAVVKSLIKSMMGVIGKVYQFFDAQLPTFLNCPICGVFINPL